MDEGNQFNRMSVVATLHDMLESQSAAETLDPPPLDPHTGAQSAAARGTPSTSQ